MPSLTRSEAAERVPCWRPFLPDRSRSDHRRRNVPVEHPASRSTPAPAPETFLDIGLKRCISVQLNGDRVELGRPARRPAARWPACAETQRVVVVADMRYSKQCEGLHRYVDPADGRVYLYAFVYIDNAPRVFACFDQPDLKAPYTFTVTVRSRTGRCSATAPPAEAGPGRWELAATPPQATYLTTLVAGPYESVYHDHDGDPARLPLPGLAGRVRSRRDLDEMFEVTGQCLDEYQRMFGVHYPFGKLDHVFVPGVQPAVLGPSGLRAAARAVPVPARRAPRASARPGLSCWRTGISLMWLAGLVTNAWWDDLWLGPGVRRLHGAPGDQRGDQVPRAADHLRGPAQGPGVTSPTSAARPIRSAWTGRTCRPCCWKWTGSPTSKAIRCIRQLAAPGRHRGACAPVCAPTSTGTPSAPRPTPTSCAALSEATGQDLTGWAACGSPTCNVNTLIREHHRDRRRDLGRRDRQTASAVASGAPAAHAGRRPLRRRRGRAPSASSRRRAHRAARTGRPPGAETVAAQRRRPDLCQDPVRRRVRWPPCRELLAHALAAEPGDGVVRSCCSPYRTAPSRRPRTWSW